ncbi:hypothetical protein J6590_090115 [Homalodisca vitripennis]|nr:hypothetical protein J6590_090115 [Homalodisca vitripennis]
MGRTEPSLDCLNSWTPAVMEWFQPCRVVWVNALRGYAPLAPGPLVLLAMCWSVPLSPGTPHECFTFLDMSSLF